MGLIGDPDNINIMSPQPQPPPSEKAAVLDAMKDTDVAKKCSVDILKDETKPCLLYTSPSPRDLSTSRMPSSA